MTITTNVATKVAAVATGLTMAVSMLAAAPLAHASALTSSQVAAIISLLQSFGADSATIANVQSSLTGSAPSMPSTGPSTSSCSFTRDLTVGSKGADVTCLQNALIGAGFSIPAGATGFFGSQSVAAVIAWQKSAGVTPAAGYFGAKSRAAFGLSGSTPSNPSGPITGNGLKVMLASDSPVGTALVQAQASADLAHFTFQNPTGAAIMVTNAAFKRIGVSNDSTMTNVYLYNGAVRLTDSAGVSSGAFNFNNPTGLFVVPAGGSYTVSVRSDIANTTAGQQIGVQLVSVASNGALDSSVSLPISGGLQAISSATLASVAFNTSTLPSAATVDPQADYTVWQNTVTVGTRAVMFKAFALRNIGSIQGGDVVNFRLYVDGVKLGSAVAAVDSNNMVTFDLSAAPVRLETGGRVVKVVADIVGGASRTFQMSLRYPGDATFVDTDLNQPVLITGDSTSSSNTFAAHSATSATINSVSTSAPSISRSADSPTSNVSKGASNVKWASFKIIANGEAVKVDNINVSADTSVSGSGLDNGKVFLNGVQVGSTKDLAEYGGTTTNFTFGSSFIVPVGQTAVVDIYADAKTSSSGDLTNNETVKIYLGVGSSNAQGQTSLSSINVPASELTGNQIVVSSASLAASKASYYGNQTVIAGATQAKIGAFTLSAGSTEGVNVNTIEVGFAQAVSSTITNLTLKNHDTGMVFGTPKSTVNTTNSFTGSVTVAKSSSMTFDVYADIKTGANAGVIGQGAAGPQSPTTQSTVTTNTTGTGSDTGSSISVATAPTLQAITVGSATLTVSQNAGSTPDSANIIASDATSLVKIGAFRFTSQYSYYNVDKLEIQIPANGAATSVANVYVKYLDVNGVQQTSIPVSLSLPASGGPNATAVFTNLSFYVPQDNSRDLEVYIDVPSISSGATSGKGITASLAANEGFNATDSSGAVKSNIGASNLASSATTGKGTMYPRKSIATLGAGTAPSANLAAGTNAVLGRVTVSADAAGDIDWGQMVFTITKTSAVTIGATSTLALWDVTGSASQVAGTFATTTGNLVGGLDAFGGSSTGGQLHFRPTTVQTVSLGSTRTYELRGTVGGLAAGSNSLSVSIANPSTTATANNNFSTIAGATFGTAGNASFAWSDWSDTTNHATTATTATDWTNDFLVKSLPLTIGNASVSI